MGVDGLWMVLYSPERKGRREEVEDKNCALGKKKKPKKPQAIICFQQTKSTQPFVLIRDGRLPGAHLK